MKSQNERYIVEKKLYLKPSESQALKEAFPGQKFTRVARKALKLLIEQSKAEDRTVA